MPVSASSFFYWRLSDSKSSQVFMTLLSILANFNNAVVYMVSILPLIYNSASLFYKFLRTVPRAPTIICIIVTFIFHAFFQLSGKIQVFVSFFTFFYLFIFFFFFLN